MNKKTNAEKLKEKLFLDGKNGYFSVDEGVEREIEAFSDGYKTFLESSKTERLCAENSIKIAEKSGFCEFLPGEKYAPGSKVYVNHKGKAVILCVVGKRTPADGLRIIAAHIDSPRLDLKANPLYEADELGYFKTHYYGGIRKYQWAAVPLAMIGVVINEKGEKIDISIGEKPGEPRFVVTDLLPHLAAEQQKRKLEDGIRGEELNILIGSRPFRDEEESEAVKLNLMKIINEKYGFKEVDFRRAELEFVPAGGVFDVGFDHSLIGGYGQDDRVCAYPALMACVEAKTPEYTAVTVLADKEETGSDGNTGLKSAYFVNFVNDLAAGEGVPGYRVFSNSKCLSADVNAAHDPTFPNVTEKLNTAYINKGVAVTKYTGVRGKGGTSDANAEYLGFVTNMLSQGGVVWQTGELGKVDMGGGGTVAKYIANLGVETVDVGVPVLAMHSPFEIVSKLDVFMAYKGFGLFFG